jgi:hypothetical protein
MKTKHIENKKLYKINYTVLFVSNGNFLTSDAEDAIKGELAHSIMWAKDITKITAEDQIPDEWRKAIPWGDSDLAKGKGTNCMEIFEKQLILELSGIE